MADARHIGVIGGSGLYEIPGVEVIDRVKVETPFGDPSDDFVLVDFEGVEVTFLPRHGLGHRIPAPGVNFKANIHGLKKLGIDTVISVSAVGSMKEKYHPTDIVIPDQFFDNTRRRDSTFFAGGPAVHISFADPVCPALADLLFKSGENVGASVHKGGTYICIDGPAFSTRAESNLYRGWGVDIIGMTSATEAKLAREAEMCYAPMALVTDYDVWKGRDEDVTADMIIANMVKCAGTAREILLDLIPRIPDEFGCTCRNALADAIVTDLSLVERDTLERLKVILGKYLPPES